MKRYEAYRPTKYEWLTEVPTHWQTRTMRSLTTVSSERRGNREATLLSVYREYGVIVKSSRDDNHNRESEDLSNYKWVRTGDLVMNKMKMWQGSLGVSEFDGIVSPAYIVCHINDENVNRRYLHMLLRSPCYKTYYNQFSYGIRVGQWDMHYEDFKGLEVALPPREEQDQIVCYLDWQMSKINRLIATKRKEIERIQEHLDKSIEIMFDEIASAGNDSIPLGRHITSIESGTSVNSIMGTADNDSIGVLSTSCVYGNNFDLSQNKRVAPSDYGRVSCPVKKNTLIISRMNAPSLVGACGFSEKDDTRVYLPDRLWQVRFDNALMPEYAWRYLSTKRIKSWFATIATGTSSSMKNITKPQLKSIQIPFPSLEKQAETVRRIKTRCDKCNAACHVFEESIMHLIDLRTRLISDVVTGQVDVRDIKVPDGEYTYTETLEEETEEEPVADGEE